VKVLVPEAGNLQLLAFYVALGAGYFESSGIDVVPVSPPSPALAQGSFTNGDAPAGLLPAPVYERLIEARFPFVLVANLLQNDPIDLIVSRAAAEAHGLLRPLPLADRLRAMKGLRIGVGPHPRPRLDALFASQALDVESLLTVVVVPGRAQEEALASGKVDALYTHTPFLEDALLDQGAVVVVDQAAGEIPELSRRQIHALAVTRAFQGAHPGVVHGLVAAIARGEALIHTDPGAATSAVLRALPAGDRAHVERIVSLYAPAVPSTPRVSAHAISREVAFYPDGASPPDFRGIDLAAYVAEIADPPRRPRRRLRHVGALGLLAIPLVVLLAVALAEGLVSSRNRRRDTSV
jgi:ABC-type nitrate/sulfonate/bicarbonate transport system substrate-binding protein